MYHKKKIAKNKQWNQKENDQTTQLHTLLVKLIRCKEASKSGDTDYDVKKINQWEATIYFTIGQLQCILASH